jgi:hypothetical protein
VKDYYINGAYSPERGVGGPTMTGFPQLAAIYNYYLVTKAKFRYNVANNENTLPVFFGCVCRDSSPADAITTWQQANDNLEMSPTTGIQLVGQTSGQSIFRSKWYSIDPAEISGNPLQYYASPTGSIITITNFAGLTNSNPNSVVFVSFILASDLSGTNLVNGAFLDFYLELTTMFYSLKNLAS